jgi:RNA polymerase sigma factor (sigma-70 family)
LDGRFHTTRWSVVAAAGRWRPGAADEQVRSALGELAETYWPPLYAWARRRGAARDEAADLVQGFFAELVEKGGLDARPDERARFRAFLATAFRRFVAHRAERENAQKRGGGRAPLSLEAAALEREERALAEFAGGEDPERAFARRWAEAVMRRALERLELESSRAGHGERFAALRPHLALEGEAAPHARVARELDLSEGAVKVALHRLRRRYGELVREEVAGTLRDEAEVEAELADLIAALGSA